MTDILDDAIRSALADIVATAPRGADRFESKQAAHAPNRRPYLAIAAALVLVIGLAATAAVVTMRDTAPTASAPFTPPGRQIPLADLGFPTADRVEPTDGITLANLSRVVVTDGIDPVTVTTMLQYQGGETSVLVRGIQQDGTGRYAPEYVSSEFDFLANTDPVSRASWAWSSLPAGTAFVEFNDGDAELWQRPVAGVVVFPGRLADRAVAVAVADDGTELARIDQQRLQNADAQPTLVIKLANISESQIGDLKAFSSTTAADCLQSAGGSVDQHLATLPATSDVKGIWARCVELTKEAVRGHLAEMGATFSDSDLPR